MASWIGILLGVGLIGFAMFGGGGGSAFLNADAIMITIGGSIAATLISFPLSRVIKFFGLFLRLFKKEGLPVLEENVARLVALAHKASEESIYSLEKEAKQLKERYIKMGLNLVIQGAPPDRIARRYAMEVEGIRSRHQEGIQLFQFMAKVAPSFGLVGTLIGLINMLRGVGAEISPDTLGPSMATALVTTLYGALMAFLFFLPAAEKLKAFSSQEQILIGMVRDAMLMIREGKTSRELEEMLHAYLPMKDRQPFTEKLLLKQKKRPARQAKKA